LEGERSKCIGLGAQFGELTVGVAVEGGEHLGEHREVEAFIEFRREVNELDQVELGRQRVSIDEVAGRGSVVERKDLAGGEFQGRVGRAVGGDRRGT
jgi:hypothetical protein